jgi:formylglycine-generating enzyme required for sulfatase activity/class 3 adenylate cyclase
MDDLHPPYGPVRRLAAILAGDISGYSRLMGLDEEGTHARVKRQRRELIEPTIAEHHGRLVKYTGDGFLAMFDSPVEAARCAVVIQQSMVGRNASLPRQQWILYRQGVHLGDVIIEADDIYGDGVNIAVRLEGIADPGHVFISGAVYEQIKNKLVCGYQSLGDRQVKNITDPVNVYRVLPDPAAIMRARKIRWPLGVLAGLAVIAVVVAGVTGWYWLMQQRYIVIQTPPPTQPSETTASAVQAISPPAPQAIPPPAAAPSEAPKPAPSPSQQAAAPATPQAVAPRTQAPAETPKAAAPPAQAAAPIAPQAIPAPAQAPTDVPKATTPSPATAIAPVPPPAAPEMISLTGGTFSMGSNDDLSEKPIHRVTVKPFAISKFPITNRQWNACVAAKACTYAPTGKDDGPVTNVSWNDAQQFIAWLAKVTQKPFRLPNEAEWEYAARGGTGTKFWWGDQLQSGAANCKGCSEPYDAAQPLKVGSFKPNPFGLYDMGGGVHQWVADCWHKNYQGAPSDGSAWVDGDCITHVIRSGSWRNDPSYVRAASRDHYDTNVRYPTHGFRVAFSL